MDGRGSWKIGVSPACWVVGVEAVVVLLEQREEAGQVMELRWMRETILFSSVNRHVWNRPRFLTVAEVQEPLSANILLKVV